MDDLVQSIENIECCFLILFHPSNESLEATKKGFTPTVSAEKINEEIATLPLGLDRSFIPIIPALWYCLQLPRSRYDLIKPIPARLKIGQNLEIPQKIKLVPIPYLRSFLGKLKDRRPTIVICPDNPDASLYILIKSFGNVISVKTYGELNPITLKEHWRILKNIFKIEGDQFERPNYFAMNKIIGPTLLPTHFLARKIYNSDEDFLTEFESLDGSTKFAHKIQGIVSTLFYLSSNRGRNISIAEISEEELNLGIEEFSCPISMGIPGVSSRSVTSLFDKFLRKRGKRNHSEDSEYEEEILAFLVAHRALACDGIGLVAKEIHADAFHILADLEAHWARGNPKPRYIWRAMNRIGEILDNSFTSWQKSAMNHASRITCFSEFPIGIGITAGRSSPLAFHCPIAYRPIVPLSRAIAFELFEIPMIYLRDKLRILFVECIPEEDPVGKISRLGWDLINQNLRDVPAVDAHFEEVSEISQFKRILMESKYDILVISAHGGLSPDENRTGFMCGNNLIVEHELGHLPPVVIFSSCQVSPRGTGTVNITDLFFRQGAIAVFGTLMPIDVFHNSLLMTRFFANIIGTLEGTEKRFRTLEEIWCFTLTSNAFHDILLGNSGLTRWGREEKNGKSVIREFMEDRSARELRFSHMYEDSLAVLVEIAKNRGEHEKFLSLLSTQGFIPESAFYVALGWPERIVINDPFIEHQNKLLSSTII